MPNATWFLIFFNPRPGRRAEAGYRWRVGDRVFRGACKPASAFLARAAKAARDSFSSLRSSANGFTVSPDGSRLAIAGQRPPGPATIWTAPANGGPPQEFYREKGVHNPRWSKDGQHLFVFIGPTINVFPAGGGEPKPLRFPFPEVGGALDIRPDGKQIVFAHGQWNNQLWALKNLFGETR